MSFIDMVREAFRALDANRGRSALTILGIVIGIAAVIAMTALIGGVQQGLISSLGLNAARLVNFGASTPLEQKDLDRLARLMPDYEMIEGSVSAGTQMKKDDRDLYVSITGASESFYEMTGRLHIAEGRMFTAQEAATGARVVVLPRSAVKVLYGDPETQVTGKTLSLAGKDYQIVGVSEDTSMVGSSDDYFEVFTSVEAAEKDFSDGWPGLSQIMGLAREGVDVEELATRTKTEIAKLKGIADDEVDNNVWTYTMKASIDQMNQFMGSFQLIAGAVAGISLLVGGIGIMNMMLTNVTERIREIGVRRALGATRGDIVRQFLTESSVLCLVGGVIGVLLGYLVSWALAFVASNMGVLGSMMGGAGSAQVTPAISVGVIALAVGISMGIGIIFGFYPARRAARMDPVECLRYQ